MYVYSEIDEWSPGLSQNARESNPLSSQTYCFAMSVDFRQAQFFHSTITEGKILRPRARQYYYTIGLKKRIR